MCKLFGGHWFKDQLNANEIVRVVLPCQTQEIATHHF